MIKRLRIKNYRAFEFLDIPLTKINVFFGPNNAGKSSVLSAVNILSQTCDSPDHDIPLLYDGKFADYGTYYDLVYKNDVTRDIVFYLEFPIKKFSGELIDYAGMEITYHYRPRRRETVVRSTKIYWPVDNMLISTEIAEKGRNQLIKMVSGEFKGCTTGPKSSGSIILDHFIPYVTYEKTVKIPRRLDMLISRISRNLRRQMGSVIYVCPFRAPPERSYKFSGETPSDIGKRGDKAFHIIVADEMQRKAKRLNVIDEISKWLRDAEFAKEIYVNRYSERDFEVSLHNYITGEVENIVDVGYGCSQVVPILVAGYTAREGSILLMEQPELHLHPKAEAEIGSFLKDIVEKKDVQLFIESHGVHLLIRLQRHVASRQIKPEDINVFYVYPDERKKKRKLLKKIPLGEDGYFLQKWPKGFFPERLNESRELAKLSIK